MRETRNATARQPISSSPATPSTSRESAGGASTLGSRSPVHAVPLVDLIGELERRLGTLLDGHRTYLTPKQAADFLQLSERTLFDLPIPKVKIGRLVRFDRADLVAYADQLKTAAVAE